MNELVQSLHVRCAAINAEVEAMKAGNAQREANNDIIEFGYIDFMRCSTELYSIAEALREMAG